MMRFTHSRFTAKKRRLPAFPKPFPLHAFPKPFPLHGAECVLEAHFGCPIELCGDDTDDNGRMTLRCLLEVYD